MTYFEGFIVPVPEANKDAFRDHANQLAPLLKECGVRRQVEAWDSDVPEGKVTDFRKSVDAKPDEKVAFAWFEYPDRQARDATNANMMSDPRMQDPGEAPFDGKRMILGGFDAIVEEGFGGRDLYRRLRRSRSRGKARGLSRARVENGQGVPPAWRKPRGRGLR